MDNILGIAVCIFAVLWLIKWTAIILGLALCKVHIAMCLYRGHKADKAVSSPSEDEELCQKKSTGISRRLSYFLRGLKKYELHLVSTIPSHFVRKKIYQYIFGIRMEKTTVIYKGLTVVDPWKIVIGAGSIIGDDNILDGREGIFIGDNVNLSSQVRIWTGQHNVQGKKFEYFGKAVHIGNRAWVSGNVTILPGVTIGEGAVIASGAVVTKDVEPFAIYAGIPAEKIGDRNSDIDYTFEGKHDWFF